MTNLVHVRKSLLQFKESPRDINAGKIAEFLILYNAVYSAAIKKYRSRIFEGADIDWSFYSSELKREIATYNYSEVNRLFSFDARDLSLKVVKVSKESPLSIILEGSLIALVLAVILSGGEVDILRLKFKLNPIGFGIGSLKRVLKPSGADKIGYNLRSGKIKLSPDELELLRLHKLKDAPKGGFQRFLANLNLRVDPQSNEIELTGSEIKRIIEYSEASGKGGWQSRIKRIFGRHFNVG